MAIDDKKVENQRKKFIQTAKEHGCDESEADFAEKMKKLAEATPEKEKIDG